MPFIRRCVLAAMLAVWPLAAPAQQAAPALDHRKLIAENLGKLFAADAQVRGIAVSELRQVTSAAGLMWAACVRVSATGVSGQPTSPRVYVVTFRRSAIDDRRPASGDDCAGAQFTPLEAGR